MSVCGGKRHPRTSIFDWRAAILILRGHTVPHRVKRYPLAHIMRATSRIWSVKAKQGVGASARVRHVFFFFAGHEFDVPTLTLDPVNAKGRADLLTLVNSASADICA